MKVYSQKEGEEQEEGVQLIKRGQLGSQVHSSLILQSVLQKIREWCTRCGRLNTYINLIALVAGFQIPKQC